MARYPSAVWRPIPENTSQPPMRATQVIMHVRAGEGDSLEGLWNSAGNGLESHFYIRYNGVVEQYVDTSRSADANLTANLRSDGTGAISIETEGLEFGSWTEAQLAALLNICWWANETHDIPLRVCPGPNDPGVGYHVMWGAPGPWTPRAKSCPGPERVAQFKDLITPTLLEGEDMLPLSDTDVNRIAAAVWAKVAAGLSDSTHTYLPPLHRKLGNPASPEPDSVLGRLGGLAQQVTAIAPGAPADVAALKTALKEILKEGVDA